MSKQEYTNNSLSPQWYMVYKQAQPLKNQTVTENQRNKSITDNNENKKWSK